MVGVSIMAIICTTCATFAERLALTHRDLVGLRAVSVSPEISVALYVFVGCRPEDVAFIRCSACHGQLYSLPHICGCSEMQQQQQVSVICVISLGQVASDNCQ